MNFWRIIDVLNKRKWLILFSVVVTTALTWGATRLVGAKWDATVSFWLPPTPPVEQSTAQAMAEDAKWDSILGLQYAKARALAYGQMVKSQQVLQPALARIGISNPPQDITQRIEFTALSGRLYELHVMDSSP